MLTGIRVLNRCGTSNTAANGPISGLTLAGVPPVLRRPVRCRHDADQASCGSKENNEIELVDFFTTRV
jgi:hypothetical protein